MDTLPTLVSHVDPSGVVHSDWPFLARLPHIVLDFLSCGIIVMENLPILFEKLPCVVSCLFPGLHMDQEHQNLWEYPHFYQSLFQCILLSIYQDHSSCTKERV